MTTIAYKNGIIAYDSYTTAAATITNSETDKKLVVNGIVFFLSGYCCDFDSFIKAYFGEEEIDDKVDASAIVVDKKKVYIASVADDKGFWKQEITDFPCYSIGSGWHHALTAMDMGATAKEAIGWAAKRDLGTGGKVHTYKVK